PRGRGRRGGVLRQVRPHDDDPGRHRQRPADHPGGRCAGEARRVRDRPDRALDRPGRQLTSRRQPEETQRADRQDPFRTFNFRLEMDGTEVASFSDVKGLQSEGEVADYRTGMDIPLTNRRLPGLRKFGPISLSRGMVHDATLWDWYRNIVNGKPD